MMSRRLLPVALCATLLLGCATPSLSGDFVLVGAGSHGTTMWRVDDRARGVSCYYIGDGGISCVRTSPALVVEDTSAGTFMDSCRNRFVQSRTYTDTLVVMNDWRATPSGYRYCIELFTGGRR